MKIFVGLYKPEFERDKVFIEYIDRIVKYYFDG
jgi:hypothetical protein